MADLDAKQAERERATLTHQELTVRTKTRQTPEEKSALKQAVLAMQRTGATHKQMAEHFGLKPYQIESVVQGSGTVRSVHCETPINYFAHVSVRRKCLKCGNEFDGGKFIRMCDECKLDRETTRW